MKKHSSNTISKVLEGAKSRTKFQLSSSLYLRGQYSPEGLSCTYRADTREATGPEGIFEVGFKARGSSYAITSHVGLTGNCKYVSTAVQIEPALKFGGAYKSIYAVQPRIGVLVPDIDVATTAVIMNPEIDSESVENLRSNSALEAELAVFGDIDSKNIASARKIVGWKSLHMASCDLILNPQFKPIHYRIFIPSADNKEATTIEKLARRTEKLTADKRYLTLKEAQELAQGLDALEQSKTVKKDARGKIHRITMVDVDHDTARAVRTVLAEHHAFIKEHSGKHTVFFKQSPMKKSEVLEQITDASIKPKKS